ncbi:MAG: HD domain-containing protein [Smithellaceae bacterium]
MQGMLPADGMNVYFYLAFFAIYSFMGWVLEVIYRSLKQRKFVNAGFLFGPFVPIYGTGAAVVILLHPLLSQWHYVGQFLVIGLALTAIEYATGAAAEKIFKLKLWDYTGSRFNLHGRVCLHFSAAWTVLAFAFLLLIHPAVSRYVSLVNFEILQIAMVAFMVYFVIDYTCSVMALGAFRTRVAYLYSEYFNLSNTEIDTIMKSLQRYRSAFPALNRYISNNINDNIKEKVDSFLKPIQEKIILEMAGRTPFEEEYYGLIADILDHPEFLKLKDFFHHNSSIYHHVHDVAYLAYRICKYLKLDYRSAARGALLHDFFLYDWRNHDVPDLAKEKFHGLEHPKIAVANARKYFSINEIEEDIIRKHMWPLTLVPPMYKESFIVSFADKYLSSKEFLNEYKRRINNQARKIGSRKEKPEA